MIVLFHESSRRQNGERVAAHKIFKSNCLSSDMDSPRGKKSICRGWDRYPREPLFDRTLLRLIYTRGIVHNTYHKMAATIP